MIERHGILFGIATAILASIGMVGGTTIEPIPIAEDAPKALQDLHAKYLSALASVQKAVNGEEAALREKLTDALTRVQQKAQSEGDLETVIAARDATGSLNKESPDVPTTAGKNAKVKAMLDVYAKQRAGILRRSELRHVPVLKSYANGLKALTDAATKERRIEDAVKYRSASKAIAARIASIKPPASAGPSSPKPRVNPLGSTPKKKEKWISERASYESSSIHTRFKPLPGFLTTEGEFYSGGRPKDAFAFHTKSGDGEWVNVDLGSMHTVTRMEIVNRTNEANRSRILGVKVQLSADGKQWETVTVIKDSADELEIPVKPAFPARYVKILGPPGKPLHLKHLKVFGWQGE